MDVGREGNGKVGWSQGLHKTQDYWILWENVLGVPNCLNSKLFSFSKSFLFIFLRFLCRYFLKSLLNVLQCCFCFISWFFGLEACGILAPQPGIEPTHHPPALPHHMALEGKVLTTEPPGKSPIVIFWIIGMQRTIIKGEGGKTSRCYLFGF